MNKDIYKVFDLMRFPLIVAVVCIHINALGTWGGVENTFIYSALNRSLPQMAVPLFFLMSGFLFFRDINQKWDWTAYRKKIKRRVFTLVIPYIVWNILAFSADLAWFGAKGVLTKDFSQAADYLKTFSLSVFWSIKPIGLHTTNWLGISTATAGPMDLPLWYLRDLIVLVALAPLLWHLLKYTKGWILALLALGYVSRIWITVPGFGITGLFFFSIGAYMGMKQIDILEVCRRIKWIWIPTIALAVLVVAFKGTYTKIGENLMPFYVISAIVTAINVAHYYSRKGKTATPFLVKSCFFIFACHEVVVKDVVKVLIEKVFGGSVVWPLQFVFMVTLIVLICLGLYYIISRWLPGLSKVLAGNK